MSIATFAAGCFWGVQKAFKQVPGVLTTRVGYAGGHTHQPTYEQVLKGDTGHAEAVRVEYDPEQISYQQLLEVFWQCHNPTTLNRQGLDIGRQYRSAVFWHTDEQRELAMASKSEFEQTKHYYDPVVTEIEACQCFYEAEEYHQDYLAKHQEKTCSSTQAVDNLGDLIDGAHA